MPRSLPDSVKYGALPFLARLLISSEFVIAVNGKIEVATVMTVTMSADHRVVDGGTGAKFLATLKQFIEEPASMLL